MTLGKGYFDSYNKAQDKPTGERKEFVKKDISGPQVAIIKDVTFNTYNDQERVSFKLFFPGFNQVEFDNVTLSEAAAPVLKGKLKIAYPDFAPETDQEFREKLVSLIGGKLEVNVKKQEDSKYLKFYWNKYTPPAVEVEDDGDVPF